MKKLIAIAALAIAIVTGCILYGSSVDAENKGKAAVAAAQMQDERDARRAELDKQEHETTCKLHAGDAAALKLHGCK